MKPRVYLAGPISGLSFDEAQNGWRAVVEAWGLDNGVCVLSPLRGKDYLRGVGKLEKQYLDLSQLSSPQGIVRRDFNDVKTCDAVLANVLNATRISLGTAWEVGVAFALQKPLIAVLEPGSVHDHPFITQSATYTFSTLDEALPALLYLLGAA